MLWVIIKDCIRFLTPILKFEIFVNYKAFNKTSKDSNNWSLSMKMAFMFIWFFISMDMYVYSLLLDLRIISMDHLKNVSYFLSLNELKTKRHSSVLRALIIKYLTLNLSLIFLFFFFDPKWIRFIYYFIINIISQNKLIIHEKLPHFKIVSSTKNLMLIFHCSNLSPSNGGSVFMKRPLLKIEVFSFSILSLEIISLIIGNRLWSHLLDKWLQTHEGVNYVG